MFFPVECAGYIARIFSHFDTLALGPYIVQTMLILVAPPLFAASIYMTLGRVIVKLNAEELSMVPVRYLTKIFVVGDVISFLLQVAGKILLQPPAYPIMLMVHRWWLYGSWNFICDGCRCESRDRRSRSPTSLLWILCHRRRYIPLAREKEQAFYSC